MMAIDDHEMAMGEIEKIGGAHKHKYLLYCVLFLIASPTKGESGPSIYLNQPMSLTIIS